MCVCVNGFINFKLLFQFFVSYKAHQTPRNGEPIGHADNLQCFDINKLTTYLGLCLFFTSHCSPFRRAHWVEAHEQQNHYTLWCCGFCDRFCSLPIFMYYFRIGKVSVSFFNFVFFFFYFCFATYRFEWSPRILALLNARKIYYWQNKRQIKRMTAAIAFDFDL